MSSLSAIVPHNKWWVWLLVFAGLAVTLATIFRILTPQAEPIPETPLVTTNIDGSTSVISGVIYTGEEFTPPAQLPEATIAQQPLGSTVINKLITNYALEQVANVPNVWLGPEYRLTWVEQVNQYIFARDLDEPEVGQINLDQGLQAAIVFAQTNLPEMSVQPLTDKIIYGVGEAPTDSPDNAQVMVIPFSYVINDYPVTYYNTSSYPLQIMTTVDNQVLRAAFFPLFITVEPGISRPTLSIEEAIANINNGKGSIVRAFQPEFEFFTLDEITSGEMIEVSIEYKVDETLNIAYPFYQFIGTVTDQAGTEIRVQISTPAVATTTQ